MIFFDQYEKKAKTNLTSLFHFYRKSKKEIGHKRDEEKENSSSPTKGNKIKNIKIKSLAFFPLEI
jgi:hypothetical protein